MEYLKAVILPSRYRFASNGCENGLEAQGGEELMAHLVGDPAADGSEPRYLSIRKTIRDRIADGTYPAGTAIPSEHELSAEFDTTRLTVRNAIDGLVTQGLIRRVQGQGGVCVRHRPGPARTCHGVPRLGQGG